MAFSRPSRLERLPQELKLEIMEYLPLLGNIESLVLASPAFYATYLYCGKRLLRRFLDLDSELQSCAADVFACIEARQRKRNGPRTLKMIEEVITLYEGWSTGLLHTPSFNSLPLHTLHWLVRLHTMDVTPIKHIIAVECLSNLATHYEVYKGDDGAETAKEITKIYGSLELSNNEKTRVCKAVYRFEAFQHLFGTIRGSDGPCISNTTESDDAINELQLRTFSWLEPWETEAVASVAHCVTVLGTDIFQEQLQSLGDEGFKGVFGQSVDECHTCLVGPDRNAHDVGKKVHAHGISACMNLMQNWDRLPELPRRATSIFREGMYLGCSLHTLQTGPDYNAERNLYLFEPQRWALDRMEAGAATNGAIYGFRQASQTTRRVSWYEIDDYIDDFRSFGYTLWDKSRWDSLDTVREVNAVEGSNDDEEP